MAYKQSSCQTKLFWTNQGQTLIDFKWDARHYSSKISNQREIGHKIHKIYF